MKRPKSTATGRAKKSVGFSMHGTSIEAPDAVYGTAANFGQVQRKLEFKVSAAKEFEKFRQIPKYSHSSLAVIHPSPTREQRTIWKPPSKLGFDG